MSKILITADVHISDYRNHNLFNTPTFRLDQFDKLAQRIVYLGQRDPDIEALIIAGDFLHVASPRPYVVNRAFDFLSYVSQWLPIYLTHGQHDIDTRRTGVTGNTLLTLCNLHKSVQYIHRNFVEIGGRNFYFLGWVPDTEAQIMHLKQIGGCDVFIGHFQPGTVRVGQRNFLLAGGRDIPEKPPWKIAFVGDVHTHQVTQGSLVIPGVPLQHSFNDDPEPGFILLDTETLAWERINTIVPGEWDFLRFRYDDGGESVDEWTVVRSTAQMSSKRLQKALEKRLNIAAVIDEQVKHHQLEAVHKDMLTRVPNEVRQEVDLNFELEKLVIHDFRSIDYFEWDTIGEGVKLLFGQNGSGKSSLVNALMFALTGDGSARTLTRKGHKNMYVEVTILYGQFRHTIRRGFSTSGTLRYWINDVEQQAENQRALLAKIEANLPFLRYSDLFYHAQDRPGFLSSYNYAARVDLVARVLGLRIVQSLYDESHKRLLDLDRQLANVRARIATVNAIVEQEALVDFTYGGMIDESKETNLKIIRDSLKSLVRAERDRTERVTSQKATLVSRIERSTLDVAALATRRNQLERKTCFSCGQRITDDQCASLLEQLSTEITSKRRDIAGWRHELDALEEPSTDFVARLEERLERIVSQLSEIESMREHRSNLARLKTRIEGAKEELLALKNDQTLLLLERERLSDYKALLNPTGPIMRTLLTTLSDMLSSDTLRVRAYKTLVSGEVRPDFGVDVFISGSWIPYDEISGGQKTVVDLMILEKLIQLAGGIGLVIFDETFKFLDGENLEKIVEVIKGMHCSSIFIVSHVEGFPYWDTSIHTYLDHNKVTQYTIR
jgi:DNA repair exonuclease SbcCD nuclease subunit